MARTLFIDVDALAFVQGFRNQARMAPKDFFDGDSSTINIHFLEQTGISGRPYAYIDKSSASVKMGLGQPGGQPTAGTLFLQSGIDQTSGTLTIGVRYKILSFETGDNFSNVGASSNATGVIFEATGTTPTTWANSSALQECTDDLAYNVTASDLETALNALPAITSAGSVVVTKPSSRARYRITFNSDGDQALLSSDTTSLLPSCSSVVSERVAGSAVVQEVQEIEIVATPVAFQDSFTDLPTSVTATPSTVTSGTSTTSEVQRIDFSPNPGGGSFSITLPQDTRSVTAAVVAGVFQTTTPHGFAINQPVVGSGFTNEANWTEGVTYFVQSTPSPTSFTISATVDGAAIATATADAGTGTITTPARTSSELNASASQGDVETALQALDTIGDGGVTVSGVSGQYFIFSFTGQKANAALPELNVEDANLTAPYGKTGTLDLATFSLQDLFDASDDETLDLQFEVEVTESTKIQTYAAGVKVDEDIIKSGSLSPTPVPSALASLFTYDTESTNSSEVITLYKASSNTKCQTLVLTVGAGSAAFDTEISLASAGCAAGDVTRIRVIMPASTNPLLTFTDLDTPADLYAIDGTGAAFTQLLQFTFNGTAWESDQ